MALNDHSYFYAVLTLEWEESRGEMAEGEKEAHALSPANI